LRKISTYYCLHHIRIAFGSESNSLGADFNEFESKCFRFDFHGKNLHSTSWPRLKSGEAVPHQLCSMVRYVHLLKTSNPSAPAKLSIKELSFKVNSELVLSKYIAPPSPA